MSGSQTWWNRIRACGRNHIAALLAILLVASSVVSAQEPAPPPGGASPATGQNQADNAATDPLERLIYVPFRNLKEVFEKQGSTVFVPYADYLKKWRSLPDAEKPVVEAVITEANYVARIDQSLMRIQADLTVQVLGKPWVEIPVKFGGAAVGKLTAPDNAQILLKGTGNGSYSLLFGTAGTHRIQLELAAAIQTSPDGRSAKFDVPPSGVTTFELAIPEANQTVDISPTLVPLPVQVADGETRIRASLGATTSISARWHPRTSLKPDMDLLAAVSNYQKITLRDGLVHTAARLEYDVLRGELSELAVAVPVGHRILGVTSDTARIKGWKSEPGEKRQTVTVEFLSAMTAKFTLDIHTEREFSDEAIELIGRTDQGQWFGIHAVDAVRESGQVSIAAGKDLSLQFEQLLGVARIEPEETHESIRQGSAPAFKFFSPNIRLRAVVKPLEPRLSVDSAYTYEIHDDELRATAILNYTIARAGIFELRIKLPDWLLIDSVTDDHGWIREHHLEGEGEEHSVRVVLHQKTPAEDRFQIILRGHVKFEEASETVELPLPIPEPAGIERETGTVTVRVPESIELITDPESIKSAQPLAVPEATQPGDRFRTAAAWSFNRRPVDIAIRTERRPTRLTARVGTTIQLKEEIVEVAADLTYSVQFAGLDTFRFAVPEAVSSRVQIVSLEGPSAPAIKQKTAAATAVDGWVTWTVTMQRDVTGSHRFRVSWDQKPVAPESGEGAAKAGPVVTRSAVQTIKVLGLDEESDKRKVALSDVSGEIAVERDRALSITAKALEPSLEAIDVRELSLLPQSGSLAWRYFRQPVGLQLEATKHEIQEVVETVVMRNLVEIVARRDLKANYRCRYWMKSSERQRLRIDVPVGSELLGVFLDGQPVSPELNTKPLEDKSWTSYFLNVSRSKPSDEPFSLTLQMLTQISAQKTPFEGWGGRIQLRLPQIGGADSSGVATQQLQTVVWVPKDCVLIGDPDGFTNESRLPLESSLLAVDYRPGTSRLDAESWINVPSAGFVDFPTEGSKFRFSNLGGRPVLEVWWASKPSYTWLYSGALVVLALLLLNVRWERKLLLVLLAAFAAVLSGLSSPGWSAEIVSASKYGIAALAGIWILHAVFGRRANGSKQPPDSSGPRIGAGLTAVIPPPGVFDDVRRQLGH